MRRCLITLQLIYSYIALLVVMPTQRAMLRLVSRTPVSFYIHALGFATTHPLQWTFFLRSTLASIVRGILALHYLCCCWL